MLDVVVVVVVDVVVVVAVTAAAVGSLPLHYHHHHHQQQQQDKLILFFLFPSLPSSLLLVYVRVLFVSVYILSLPSLNPSLPPSLPPYVHLLCASLLVCLFSLPVLVDLSLLQKHTSTIPPHRKISSLPPSLPPSLL